MGFVAIGLRYSDGLFRDLLALIGNSHERKQSYLFKVVRSNICGVPVSSMICSKQPLESRDSM